MFGYVLPFKPELKMKEWQAYRSVYCGLCKELKRNYGFFSRMVLNYDFVLLSLITDNLNKEQANCTAQNCIANPFQKRPVCNYTKGLEFSSHALVLSVFYKLKDNLNDDKLLKRIPSLAFYPIAKAKRNKAALNYKNLDEILANETNHQNEIESRSSLSYDEAADPTSVMLGSIFSMASDVNNKAALYRFGQFLGKIIYYLDAAEDYEKDKKNNAYNVFLLNNLSKEEADKKAKQLCKLCAYEMSLAYSLLPRAHYSDLLDNIIYLGIAQSIENAGKPKEKTKITQKD